MTLEQQVCTISQAKKLKELGVPQNNTSLFLWVGWKWEGQDSIDWKIERYNKEYFTEESNRLFAAFTVAELGEMLPYELFSPAAIGDRKVMNNSTRSVAIWKYENKWNNRHTESEVNSNSFLNEAECRADMLIFLLENKLISL